MFDFIQRLPFFNAIYRMVGPIYKAGRNIVLKRKAKKVFVNYIDFIDIRNNKGSGTISLCTHDGLKIIARKNALDAFIIQEIFFEKSYIKHVRLPQSPIIVDVGGYIGDFSLYAAKYLAPQRIFVYEPAAENYNILIENVKLNGFEDVISVQNRAVGNSRQLILCVDKRGDGEIHASAYMYKHAEHRTIECHSISDIVLVNRIDRIDLLKLDCEGGEYEILSTMPEAIMNQIGNIVFEFHKIENYKSLLESNLKKLQSNGFIVYREGNIITAVREEFDQSKLTISN